MKSSTSDTADGVAAPSKHNRHAVAVNSRRGTRVSLGPALIALLVTVALVPALFVIGLLSSSTSAAIHTLAESTMRQAVRRLENDTLNHLGQAHTMLNAMLDADSTVSADVSHDGQNWFSDLPAFERLAFSLTTQTADVPYVYIGAADGSFLGVEQEANGHVVRQIRADETARRQYLAATPGDRSLLLVVEEKRYDPRVRPWYKLAAERGSRVFTDVYRSAVKSQFDLTLAQPVYSSSTHELLGVIATDMSLAHIDDLVRTTRISEHAITYLVDGKGLLVASSTGEPLTVDQEGQQVRLSPQGSGSDVIRRSWQQLALDPDSAGPSLHTLRDEPASHHDWLQSLDWFNWLGTKDERLLALKQPFGSEYGLKWHLVVVAPELDFTHQVITARRWSVAMLAVVLLASGLLTFLIARGLSRHFARLNQAAGELGEGKIPDVIERTPFQEVYALSRALHSSADQLQMSTQEVQRKNEALKQSALTLERRINERTAELTESRAEALGAAQAKAAFLAVMSHEIRTPLNGVLGMSELLSHTAMDASQAEMLSVVRTSGQQLLSVVNDILDFSKIEAGKLELDPHPFDLHRCLQDVCRMMALAAQAKALVLEHHLGPEVVRWVHGDATRIRQVLLNLLNNAVKFTPKGSVVLSVTQSPGQHGVRFSVRDTGIGIPAESLKQLFQPFHQADAAVSRHHGGTGLGLAISHHLVSLMGGELKVETSVDRGSDFHFTLSLPPSVAPDPSPQDLTLASIAGNTRGIARVLVVDDNLVNRQVAIAMLQRLGHEYAEAIDGRQALEMTSLAIETGQAFTHILMDRHMQDMDGLEATRAIRLRWGTRSPHIIGLSASSIGDDEQACLAAGMEAYLPKPVTLQQLDLALRGDWQPTSLSADDGPIEAAGSTLPWLDAARLDDFAEFDDEHGSLRKEVLGDFMRTLPDHLARIRQAVNEQVVLPAEVAKALHGLRGSADNVGARRLGARSATLEVMAAAGRMQDQHVQELAELVEGTTIAVHQAIKGQYGLK